MQILKRKKNFAYDFGTNFILNAMDVLHLYNIYEINSLNIIVSLHLLLTGAKFPYSTQKLCLSIHKKKPQAI